LCQTLFRDATWSENDGSAATITRFSIFQPHGFTVDDARDSAPASIQHPFRGATRR
jgi:hypothetical protein